MSNIVRHKEFKKVVDALWSKVKTNFLTDITYNSTDKKLKKTKNGAETEITKIVTEWDDLEYATQSNNFNIFNPSTFEDGKYYNSGGYHEPDPNWGNFKIPCSGGDTFTLFKKKYDSQNIAILNGGVWQQNLVVSSINDNGWVKYTINVPTSVQVDSISVSVHNPTNNYKSDVMIFSGNVNTPNKYIPFTNSREVSVDGEKVAITFDSSNTTLTSSTTVDAIKELDSKIVNTGTVKRVNGQDPNLQGEVTVGIADITGLQGELNSKVNNSQIGNAPGQIPQIENNTGRLSTSIIPDLAITSVEYANSDQEMMNKNVQVGDVIVAGHESNATYMCKDANAQNKNDKFIKINMGLPVVKNINGHTPDTTGAITIDGTQINVDGQLPGTTIKGELDKCVRTVNNVTPNNGNVTINALQMYGTYNNIGGTVQAHLNTIKNSIDSNTNKITALEAKHSTHVVGEFMACYGKGESFTTKEGSVFLHLNGRLIRHADYPNLAPALGITGTVNAYNLPSINDITDNFDNNTRRAVRKHYVCAKA